MYSSLLHKFSLPRLQLVLVQPLLDSSSGLTKEAILIYYKGLCTESRFDSCNYPLVEFLPVIQTFFHRIHI